MQLKLYFIAIAEHERSTKKGQKKANIATSDNSKGIEDNIIKGFAIWTVGGFVSIFPLFLYSFLKSTSAQNFSSILRDFFSNKDLFLVLSTLLVSAVMEVAFCKNKRTHTVALLCIGIIFLLVNFYFYVIQQFGNSFYALGKYVHCICGFLLISCIVYSIFAFIVSCGVEETDKN